MTTARSLEAMFRLLEDREPDKGGYRVMPVGLPSDGFVAIDRRAAATF